MFMGILSNVIPHFILALNLILILSKISAFIPPLPSPAGKFQLLELKLGVTYRNSMMHI